MMRSRKRLKKRKPPAQPMKPYMMRATLPGVVRGVVMPKPVVTTATTREALGPNTSHCDVTCDTTKTVALVAKRSTTLLH